MSKILLSLFLFIQINTFANTKINGVATDFKGYEVTIYHYSDLFTNTKEILGYSTIDSEGKFSINFPLTKTSKTQIEIDQKTTTLYIDKGKVYNILLSYDQKLNAGRLFDKRLSLEFTFPKESETNQLIMRFNQDFTEFMDTHYAAFVKRDRSAEAEVDKFEINSLNKFKKYQNTFVYNYIRYNLAIMKESMNVSFSKKDKGMSNQGVKAELYKNYLQNQPVLFNNPEYAALFKTFFKGELKEITLQTAGIPIVKAINTKSSFKELTSALEAFPFLKEKSFRELFAIYSLSEIYQDKYFNKTHIEKMLQQAATLLENTELKLIAKNYLKKLTFKPTQKGSIANNFLLKDASNKTFELKEFNDKPIYLTFFSTKNIPSQKELKILKGIVDKYRTNIHFISICTDNDPKKFQEYVFKHKDYNWTILHLGKNRAILDKYQVKTTPSYCLIDKGLKIIQLHTARPGGNSERATEANIEKIFHDLSKR